MLSIIQNNPYRILGVFSSSSQKDVVANVSKIERYLSVNKNVAFEVDLNSVLPHVLRDKDSVQNAKSKLTLPKDQILYGLFWFVSVTDFDKIALNNANDGNIDKAISILEKKKSSSSLQNRLILSLIKEDYGKAISLAHKLYTEYAVDIQHTIAGDDTHVVSGDDLMHLFLNVLCEELSPIAVNKYDIPQQCKEYVQEKAIDPIVQQIESCIASAKDTKKQGADKRLAAGELLMTSTMPLLSEFQVLVSKGDMRYQLLADKLGIEILQCGIDYYNDSDDDDSAQKAYRLQKYALSIVVGSSAKERCKENVDILERVISQLPPVSVLKFHRTIEAELSTFSMNADKIKYSISLLKNCARPILSIKEVLGSKDDYYLRISTRVINNALGNVIAEVNEVLEDDNADFTIIKAVLIEAWRTQLYMDKFDLEAGYKRDRYDINRKSLHDLIEKMKGFESSSHSFMYQYGCGFCNDLDVSDIDLRTESEYYKTCKSKQDYGYYIAKYPNGTHVKEARKKIEEFEYKSCKTIDDYKSFISKFPNSTYVSSASDILEDLRKKEKVERERKERQDKAIEECKSFEDVMTLFSKDGSMDKEKISNKAFELANTRDHYQQIVNTFGVRTSGGKKANAKIDEYIKIQQEKEERKEIFIKWIKRIGIPIIIVALILGIAAANGCFLDVSEILVKVLSVAAGIGVFFGISILLDSNNLPGCVIYLILGLSIGCAIPVWKAGDAIGDYQKAMKVEQESSGLYQQIKTKPSVSLCEEYVSKYSETQKVSEVKSILLGEYVKEAHSFDFSKVEVSSYKSDNNNPIQKIKKFGENWKNKDFASKAEQCIVSLCDSLYKVATRKGTIDGWKQYQRAVPTDYFKDSDRQMEIIEEKKWSTDNKAWNQASLLNTIEAYNKYLSKYPNGIRKSQAEKKIIDLEVARIYGGDHGELPGMDKTYYGYGSTSSITVTNNTSYTLTLLYSGPDSKRLVLSPHGTSTIKLKNGRYRIAASVSASNVRNFAGSENLDGSSYSVEYYISTTRY